MNQKLCKKYNQIRNHDDFWKDKNRSDGLNSTCKYCRKEWSQSLAGKVSGSKRGKKYFQSPKGKQTTITRLSFPKTKIRLANERRKYRKNNPQKTAARQAVSNAVKSGILPRISTLQCANKCGNTAYQYHHHSYEKKDWLNVIPLCKKCHNKEHY